MKQTVDWHSHWTRKNPGFHEGQVNTYLQQFLPLFELKPDDRIFMPLCGKAVDILWLSQQGYHVIGVELSEVAIQSFFAESDLQFVKIQHPEFVIYEAPNITLYQGDLMGLRTVGSVDPSNGLDPGAFPTRVIHVPGFGASQAR